MRALRAKAKAEKTSVSRLIRTAVETQLEIDDRRQAKGQLIEALSGAELGNWEEAHRERTEESGDRG